MSLYLWVVFALKLFDFVHNQQNFREKPIMPKHAVAFGFTSYFNIIIFWGFSAVYYSKRTWSKFLYHKLIVKANHPQQNERKERLEFFRQVFNRKPPVFCSNFTNTIAVQLRVFL